MTLVAVAVITGAFGLIAIWLRRALGGDHQNVESHLVALHEKIDAGFAANTDEHANILDASLEGDQELHKKVDTMCQSGKNERT